MRSLASALLLVSLVPGVVTAGYLVVSALEEGVPPKNPQIWRVTDESGMTLVDEVPLDGGNVRKVELWRERGMLATWCRWEDGKPLGLRAKKCRVSLIDLKNIEKPLRWVMDCDPLFGGQLLAENDSTVGVMTHGVRGPVVDGVGVYTVASADGGLREITASEMMEHLDLARYNGSIPSRRSPGLLTISLSRNGYLSYWYSVRTEPRQLSAMMSDSIVRKLGQAQWNEETLAGVVFALTDSVLLIGFDDEKEIEQRQLLLHQRDGDKWRVFSLLSGTVGQAFSEWVVFTCMALEDFQNVHRLSDYGVRSGPYRFVNWRDGRDWVEEGMGEGCEILEVWDERVLYRRRQELIEGRIDGESVVDHRVLARDPVIEEIYWGVAEGRLEE
jgi:hypothetical protein